MMALRLGSQTGSYINHVYSRMTNGQPEASVGMGATILHWTDREAGTIVEVLKDRGCTVVCVQEDEAIVTNAPAFYGDTVEYRYERCETGAKHWFRFDGDNGWRQVRENSKTGRWNVIDGAGLLIGKRDKYRDPHF